MRVFSEVMIGVVVAVSFVGAPPPPPSRLGELAPRPSAWQSVEKASDFLVLLGFSDENAAREDLRRLVEGEGSPLSGDSLPAEVRHIAVEHEDGVVLDAVPIGGSMVATQSLASPGYGHEERERIEQTLSTFGQLEGYCGHLHGYNEANEDEGWSYVFSGGWSKAPQPSDAQVSTTRYRRVG